MSCWESLHRFVSSTLSPLLTPQDFNAKITALGPLVSISSDLRMFHGKEDIWPVSIMGTKEDIPPHTEGATDTECSRGMHGGEGSRGVCRGVRVCPGPHWRGAGLQSIERPLKSGRGHTTGLWTAEGGLWMLFPRKKEAEGRSVMWSHFSFRKRGEWGGPGRWSGRGTAGRGHRWAKDLEDGGGAWRRVHSVTCTVMIRFYSLPNRHAKKALEVLLNSDH